MNPAYAGAAIMALLQFGSIVWWAATTHADRRHARILDESRDKAVASIAESVARLAETVHRYDTRLQLLERTPQPARRPHAR